MEEYCVECLKHGVYRKGQGHHIVLRNRASYMVHVPINIIPLCIDHHTSAPGGIHHNKEMMLEYLQEMQLKLKLLFTNEYYTHKEIKELLQASDNSVKAITKTLMRYKEGYKSEQLIIHMMGGKNYLEDGE